MLHASGIDKRGRDNAMCIAMITKNLRQVREALGESQAAFGERFGVDQSTVHRWETRGLPGTGAARKAVENFLASVEAGRAA